MVEVLRGQGQPYTAVIEQKRIDLSRMRILRFPENGSGLNPQEAEALKQIVLMPYVDKRSLLLTRVFLEKNRPGHVLLIPRDAPDLILESKRSHTKNNRYYSAYVNYPNTPSDKRLFLVAANSARHAEEVTRSVARGTLNCNPRSLLIDLREMTREEFIEGWINLINEGIFPPPPITRVIPDLAQYRPEFQRNTA